MMIWENISMISYRRVRETSERFSIHDLNLAESFTITKALFADFIADQHCVKSVRIRSFWYAFSRIQTEYGNLLC